MASEMGWGGLPYMVPSRTAMHYLMHAHSIIPEEEIPAGAHYRARQDMLDNVSLDKGIYVWQVMVMTIFPKNNSLLQGPRLQNSEEGFGASHHRH